VADQKKKKGCLGCSLPVAILVIVLLLAIVIVGALAGPLGPKFGITGLPAWMSLHVPAPELPAAVVFNIGDFAVTNTLLATWVTMIVLVVFALTLAGRPKLIPGKGQSIVESLFGFVHDLCVNTAGEKDGRSFFPFVMTIFVFVLFNAFLALVPGFGSIEVHKDKTGEGYTSTPTITLSGGGGQDASVQAILVDGSITGFEVTNPGSGYTSAPEVIISGGGGTGANAEEI
jgi:F0F1-type ATP synthase membrane subunit a